MSFKCFIGKYGKLVLFIDAYEWQNLVPYCFIKTILLSKMKREEAIKKYYEKVGDSCEWHVVWYYLIDYFNCNLPFSLYFSFYLTINWTLYSKICLENQNVIRRSRACTWTFANILMYCENFAFNFNILKFWILLFF